MHYSFAKSNFSSLSSCFCLDFITVTSNKQLVTIVTQIIPTIYYIMAKVGFCSINDFEIELKCFVIRKRNEKNKKNERHLYLNLKDAAASIRNPLPVDPLINFLKIQLDNIVSFPNAQCLI